LTSVSKVKGRLFGSVYVSEHEQSRDQEFTMYSVETQTVLCEPIIHRLVVPLP